MITNTVRIISMENIKKICADVRAEYVEKKGTVTSWERDIASDIAYRSSMNGRESFACIGKVNGIEHFWVRFEDTIFDATASKFGFDGEVLVIAKSEAPQYEEEHYVRIENKPPIMG